MTNRNIPPRIAVRMAEIEAQAAADGLTLPLSPYVIAVAEDDGLVVDLVSGKVSRDDVRVWPLNTRWSNEQ